MRSRFASMLAVLTAGVMPALGGVVLGGVALGGVALGGCTTGTGVGYTQVTSAPYDVGTYPYTSYDGRTVYWVGDRWFFQSGPSWYFYTQEPPPLFNYRSTYLYTPGPYYRGPGPAYRYPGGYGPSYYGPRAYGPTYAPAPPARVYTAPPQVAPPARPISPAPAARPIAPPPAVRIR